MTVLPIRVLFRRIGRVPVKEQQAWWGVNNNLQLPRAARSVTRQRSIEKRHGNAAQQCVGGNAERNRSDLPPSAHIEIHQRTEMRSPTGK